MEHISNEQDPLNRKANEFFGIRYIYPYQRLVISNILEGIQAQIILLPTGSGKSLCFSLPVLFLKGVTLVIYPLLSLMSDQKRRLEEAGIPCCILKGGMERKEIEDIFIKIRKGSMKMILTNPEWLAAERNIALLEGVVIDHFVIDETHTVSEWGETFRPAFLSLADARKRLSPRVTTAFTATASPAVLEKIKKHLFPGESPRLISANPDRPNISYGVLPVLSKRKALRDLCTSLPRPMVIFVNSRISAEVTAGELREDLNSENIRFYHAGLEADEKSRVERWFFSSRKGILTATCAYGMGVDKPDIRTVIHKSPPGSVEAYLQESGRAARDRKKGWAVLLYSQKDRENPQIQEDAWSQERYRQMILYAGNTNRCRREQLLELLDSSPEICPGCDVCNKTAREYPPDAPFFTDFFRLFRKHFSFDEAVWFLKGLTPHALTRLYLHKYPGFGSLMSWSPEEIEASLKEYMVIKRLKREHFFLK